MRVEINGTDLVIDLWGALHYFTPEDKRKAADILSTDNEVIRFVTQQILDGWTELDSSSGRLVTALSGVESNRGLDWAIREVAKRAGEVAKKEIERLESALKRREEQIQELLDEIRDRRYPPGSFTAQ